MIKLYFIAFLFFTTNCKSIKPKDHSILLSNIDVPSINYDKDLGVTLKDPFTEITMYCFDKTKDLRCAVELYLAFYTNYYRKYKSNRNLKPLIWDNRLAFAAWDWADWSIKCPSTPHQGFNEGWRELAIEQRAVKEIEQEKRHLLKPDRIDKILSLKKDFMFILMENSDYPYMSELQLSSEENQIAHANLQNKLLQSTSKNKTSKLNYKDIKVANDIGYQLVERYYQSLEHREQMFNSKITNFGAGAIYYEKKDQWYSNQEFGKSIPAGIRRTYYSRPDKSNCN